MLQFMMPSEVFSTMHCETGLADPLPPQANCVIVSTFCLLRNVFRLFLMMQLHWPISPEAVSCSMSHYQSAHQPLGAD